MTRVPAPRTRVLGGFWGNRLAMNARRAIDHQWQQLERTGCLRNFRLVREPSAGFREGIFFSDSDAYKWLEAASLLLSDSADPTLRERVAQLIDGIAAAQEDDGYLYTYNQLLFPGQRWENLQVEHEMYCLGHLIEAGVSHYSATGETSLLDVARRSADLLVREFSNAAPSRVDGHEEIELALLRLYRATGEGSYFALARSLLERRGHQQPFFLLLLPQLWRTIRRLVAVRRRQKAYRAEHPDQAQVRLPPGNKPKIPASTWLRAAVDFCSGRNFQQHAPLRQQTVPVGHAVRFTYLETAAAMLCRESNDAELRATLERAWEHMVGHRMYVTGGLGSLPIIEGFGRDDELDPEVAYAETCAAIGSMRWNQEMAGLTGEARYDDLFEWQLYNASAVGMGWDGDSYLYNNPLTCRGGIMRVPWYLVPCCPSNLSRTWASLGQHVCRTSPPHLYIAQYISSEVQLDWGRLTIESGLPWKGVVRIQLDPYAATESTLHLRLPSWADGFELCCNGVAVSPERSPVLPAAEAACGYSPMGASWLTLRRTWNRGDVLELTLSMSLRLYRQQPQVPGCGGKAALARGPLVYCLESIDNPGDLFGVRVRSDSLSVVHDPSLFDGIETICGTASDGRSLRFVPYMMWGNRGPSQMTVFFDVDEDRRGEG